MKKILFIFACSILLFSCKKKEDDGGAVITTPTKVEGCTDKDAGNYNPKANTDDGSCVYLTDTSLHKINVVMEEYAYVRDQLGPDADQKIQQIVNTYKDRIIPVKIFVDQTNYYPGTSQLKIPKHSNLRQSNGDIQKVFAANFNLLDFTWVKTPHDQPPFYLQVESGKAVGREGWIHSADYLFNTHYKSKTGKDLTSPVNPGVLGLYDPTTKKLTIRSQVYFTVDRDADPPPGVTILLLENNIVATQLTPDGPDNKYVHNYVLRDVIPNTFGDAQYFTTGEKRVAGYRTPIKEYVVDIPDNVNIANCHLVIYVTYRVIGKDEILTANTGDIIIQD